MLNPYLYFRAFLAWLTPAVFVNNFLFLNDMKVQRCLSFALDHHIHFFVRQLFAYVGCSKIVDSVANMNQALETYLLASSDQ